MKSFISINMVLLIVLFIGYAYITNSESKSLFICNIFSDLWFFFVTPIVGFMVNIIAYIINKNSCYLILGLVYLVFYLFRVTTIFVIEKMDVYYYRKNLPIIKDKLDKYLNSVNLDIIENYNIILSRTADSNGVVLKIKTDENLKRNDYLIYKKEIEDMLSEYKIRVSCE